jgi:hypothetical protein
MLYTNPHVSTFYQQFMAIATFKRLHAEGLISDDAFQRAETRELFQQRLTLLRAAAFRYSTVTS